MTVLLDTHAFLWMIVDDKRLSKRAREILTSADNDLLLSVASLWEMVLKSTAGKLRLQSDPAAFLSAMLAANQIRTLPISDRHVLWTAGLPELHRDPFDRLLVAQAQIERIPIVTSDPLIRKYAVKTIW
jgi:PIN domain nuclease of toxin-antitoxin system